MPRWRHDLTRLLPFIALFALVFAGCAGPLEIKYEPRTTGQFTTAVPAKVFVDTFLDRRDLSGRHPRAIGKIESPVSDMTGSELVLSEDVTSIVERAYAKELALAGFTVVDSREEAARLLAGEVREFSLDIGGRDEVAIKVTTQVRDARSGEVIWTGTDGERGERFAGVMGNSRATISNYIAASLQKVLRRSIASAGERLSVEAAKGPEKAVEDKAAPAVSAAGKAVVAASPGRSKVYFDGIYYGLTPITIEMPPGVYEITITQKGYKPFVERVSVRRGEKTEIEAELERE